MTSAIYLKSQWNKS